MHRPFLAMALLQNPEGPFESIYSQSIIAAQNSASFIIQTAARYLEKAPESISRHWDVWIYVPSAAVSVSTDILGVSWDGPIQIAHRLSVILDHRCFNRDPYSEYAIQREERLGSCHQDLGEWRGLLVVRKGGAREWIKTLQRSPRPSYLTNILLVLRARIEPESE